MSLLTIWKLFYLEHRECGRPEVTKVQYASFTTGSRFKRVGGPVCQREASSHPDDLDGQQGLPGGDGTRHPPAASTRSAMIQALFSRVSFFRQRAVALFHRTDQLKADSVERRERWNQVIAEHKKDQQKSKQ